MNKACLFTWDFDLLLQSIEKLGANLPDMFRNWHRKRRLRKVCGDELPWKCQVGTTEGVGCKSVGLHIQLNLIITCFNVIMLSM